MIKGILIPAGTILVLGSVVGLLVANARRWVMKLPENSPVNFVAAGSEREERSVVVCVGDSITHGAVSSSYIDILGQRPTMEDYVLINAGINGQLAYHITQRLPEIEACDPDVVTILVGTNDVNALLTEKSLERYMTEQDLPQTPDAEWYRKNLTDIVASLQRNTRARIALISLPPLGEDPDHRAWRLAAEYSAIVKEVTRAMGVAYLPLNERMSEYLAEAPAVSKHRAEEARSVMIMAIARHYIFRQSFDRISRANGMRLLTDNLHLNDRAAEMVADLVEAFVIATY